MSKLSIHLISDVHLEPPITIAQGEELIKKLFSKPKNPGILILAGDIGDSYSELYRRFLLSAKASYKYVILVPGNHEYYTDGKRDISVVKEHLQRLAEEIGFILLDNSDFVIGNLRFIGSTCWPIVPEEQYEVLKREGYGLVSRVTNNSHRLDYGDFKRLHDEDVRYLKSAVESSKETCVIITHYPPSSYMLEDAVEHSPHVALHYNRGLIEEVSKQNTPIWFCGHCHNSKRYWVKGSKILLVANCFAGGHYDENFSINI